MNDFKVYYNEMKIKYSFYETYLLDLLSAHI